MNDSLCKVLQNWATPGNDLLTLAGAAMSDVATTSQRKLQVCKKKKASFRAFRSPSMSVGSRG